MLSRPRSRPRQLARKRVDQFFEKNLKIDIWGHAPEEPIKDITVSSVELRQLRDDIRLLIGNEGRKSFWTGLVVNALFFVAGILASAVPLSLAEVMTLLRLK